MVDPRGKSSTSTLNRGCCSIARPGRGLGAVMAHSEFPRLEFALATARIGSSLTR